jgi:hypothetical protein
MGDLKRENLLAMREKLAADRQNLMNGLLKTEGAITLNEMLIAECDKQDSKPNKKEE